VGSEIKRLGAATDDAMKKELIIAFRNRAAIEKTVASMLQLAGRGDDYSQSLTID
jgi:hypothetical protein